MLKPTIKHNGFTLIELVVVIIILGILAVIAAPKFIDLGTDAKVAVIKGAFGSMKDALRLVHMKAQIDGKLEDNVNLETQYGSYQMYRGYPETKSEATNPNLYFIETFVDVGSPTDVIKNNTSRTATYGDLHSYEDNGFSRIGYGTGNLLAGQCYVEYLHTSSVEGITMQIQGC
ncbi:prepilin-type N-terminal cleavage/methylation domain-containing protein [Shewanella sp. 5_MG-2023]|uniref:type II secretion system protein n=1 Tax=Shewanella sp. 5_MG-2023 TaxID=3062656 RepID=UPI0026E35AAE|nr:prepilin-type N-terminal cleavage/methylation domain-containing protein [Shewanella sp. 5_MG-2023]MDO6642150.1 prepilin-type N-terminal cleavage/methylation domain-containing protein [Shewanella sp. 5_MG-2023]